MTRIVKNHGRVYTPDFIVKCILDFGGYIGAESILEHHVIDNSCGDGAFLSEIVRRYCASFLQNGSDISVLKSSLETYIHGIELDEEETVKCKLNLTAVAEYYGISDVNWDILNADTLTITRYDNKMDYVFGNPPYVRVHNLFDSYSSVKKYAFAEKGMTDLYIVFFEIGFKMLSKQGVMCLITPSSWLSSKAGLVLRQYIIKHKNLSGVIDLEHFQPFDATTYTLISRFDNKQEHLAIEYNIYSGESLAKRYVCDLNLVDISIGSNFYLSDYSGLLQLKKIRESVVRDYVSVKNGFATLADGVFIGSFQFTNAIIDVIKASTGEWKKCVYPYDENGKPIPESQMSSYTDTFSYLLEHKRELSKGRDIQNDNMWYLFGRTQAINDVSKNKYAINTILKDKNSIRFEFVPAGKGVYSGLYIVSELSFEEIREVIVSDSFITYVKALKNYKSGGYYTYSSKDLQQYLNHKFTEKYG